MNAIDTNLAKLNITLPAAPRPVGSYVPFVKTGSLVFTSGQLPFQAGKLVYTGKVPTDLSIDQAKDAARLAIINAIAVLREACDGDLSRVVRIVRIGAFVQSADGFDQQPVVANGASDLLVAIFGEAGKHARAAVGTNSLPLNAAVEIEVVAEIR